MTKHAVIYLRVSTDRQALTDFDADGYSIKAQRDACLRKAKELGAKVEAEYVDRGESARTKDRTDFTRMAEDVIARGDVDYVIVHKLDRFARNRVDDALMTLALQKAGARLVSCSENIDDTPSGALLHGIMASISEFYSRNLATEVRKGFEQKVKAGGTPTRAKLGYLNARETTPDGRNVGVITVDPDRAPLIRLAFELYATGEFSFATLAEVLAAKGLRTRPTRKHQGLPLTTSQIDRILKDPYYIGIVRYQGIDYQGAHQPLIEPELFERVQNIIRAHSVSGDKRRLHHHWLKGTVFCGRCQKRLIFTKAKNRHGSVYEYFYCVGRQHYDRSCRQGWMSVEAIEDAVIRHYQTIQLAPERVQQIRAAITSRIDAMRRTADQQRDRQQAEVERIETEQLRLIQAHGAGAVPLKHLIAEQERLARELRAAQAALASTQLQFADIQRTLDQALELAGDCHAAYQQATPETRRLFDQTFFERLLISDGEVTASVLAQPFAGLMAEDLLRALDEPSKAARHGQHATGDLQAIAASWNGPSEPQPASVFSGQGSKELDMAEGVGFEPTVRRSTDSGFQDRCIRPLCHPSGRIEPSGGRVAPGSGERPLRSAGAMRGEGRPLALILA
jgi:site-specific DNA recombinase